MSLEDPTMGETFSSWTSAAERDPPKFDPGKLHTGTGIKDWWFQDGFNHEFIESCQRSVEESAAMKKVTPGKSELAPNTMPAWGVPGETPEEGEWPARDAVPRYVDVALTKERDEALARAKFQGEQGLQWAIKYGETLEKLNALRAELMAAHDRLAKFTAQNAVETEAPDPIANAIRPRRVDPRRMGLVQG